jgi:hypothetical protein
MYQAVRMEVKFAVPRWNGFPSSVTAVVSAA